jgi:hypothetical protein
MSILWAGVFSLWAGAAVLIALFISYPCFRIASNLKNSKKPFSLKIKRIRTGLILTGCLLPLACILIGLKQDYPIFKNGYSINTAYNACKKSTASPIQTENQPRKNIFEIVQGRGGLDNNQGSFTTDSGWERRPDYTGYLGSLDDANTVVCITYHYPTKPRYGCTTSGKNPQTGNYETWEYPDSPIYDPTADIVIIDWPSGKLIKSYQGVNVWGTNSCNLANEDPAIVDDYVNQAIGSAAH